MINNIAEGCSTKNNSYNNNNYYNYDIIYLTKYS